MLFGVIVSVLVALCAGAVCIAAIIIQANSMAVQRYTLVYCTSPTNVTSVTTGKMTFDSSGNSIEWEIGYTNVADNPLAIYINGPVPFGQPVGPFDLALCGTPSDLACDISIPGYLHGKIYTYQSIGLGPSITAIRDFPILYYVEVIFNTGSVHCPLGISAGW